MKVFAFTMAYNEIFFLRRWVEYYGAQVGQENLFVLDHGSTDLSTQGLGRVNIIRVPRSAFDEVRRVSFISHFYSGLLAYYDAGFVADTDEFVVANPLKYRSLTEFAANTRADALAAIGIELFHIRHLEGEFIESIPILSQRRHALFDSWLCKRSFGRIPMTFGGGMHTSDQPVVFDDDLFLIHLKNFDFRHRLARQMITANWDYSGDHGVHARRSAGYVDEIFNKIDQKVLDGQVVSSFTFRDEIERCIERTILNPSGEYDFNFVGGFTSENLRIIPPHFEGLF